MHTKEEKIRAFEKLLDVQERLRKECPWDRKQTFESLRPNTIEEVYELSDALIQKDILNVKKELGDVMEHIIFYSILGSEINSFDIADVCNQEAEKLMFRHPFIDWSDMNKSNAPECMEKPKTSVDVEMAWEKIKQKEKDGNRSVLSGVPASLPSMIKAYRIQDKARNVGFDWKKREDVWEKVFEEIQELKSELNKNNQETSTDELGDVIFSIINAARLYDLNPENALEKTNLKFIRRFNYIEKKARELGTNISDMSADEMEKLWNLSKKEEDDK